METTVAHPRTMHLHGWTIPNIASDARRWCGVVGLGRSSVSLRIIWREVGTNESALDVLLAGCRLASDASQPRPEADMGGFQSSRSAKVVEDGILVPDVPLALFERFGIELLPADTTHPLMGESRWFPLLHPDPELRGFRVVIGANFANPGFIPALPPSDSPCYYISPHEGDSPAVLPFFLPNSLLSSLLSVAPSAAETSAAAAAIARAEAVEVAADDYAAAALASPAPLLRTPPVPRAAPPAVAPQS